MNTGFCSTEECQGWADVRRMRDGATGALDAFMEVSKPGPHDQKKVQTLSSIDPHPEGSALGALGGLRERTRIEVRVVAREP
jgi:hypothetical protein